MADIEQNQDHDPYVLSELNIKEPPANWLSRFRYLGPGLILSASIEESIFAGESAQAEAATRKHLTDLRQKLEDVLVNMVLPFTKNGF